MMKIATILVALAATITAFPQHGQYSQYGGHSISHQTIHVAPVAAVAHAAPIAYHAAPAVAYHHAAPVAVKAVAVEHEPIAPAIYDFEYAVHDPHTGDIKEQKESRKEDVVEGYYSLIEPDGRKRTVHYRSDKHNGFNAVVQHEGKAVHAQPVAKVAAAVPVVKAAAPLISYAAPIAHHGYSSHY